MKAASTSASAPTSSITEESAVGGITPITHQPSEEYRSDSIFPRSKWRKQVEDYERRWSRYSRYVSQVKQAFDGVRSKLPPTTPSPTTSTIKPPSELSFAFSDFTTTVNEQGKEVDDDEDHDSDLIGGSPEVRAWMETVWEFGGPGSWFDLEDEDETTQSISHAIRIIRDCTTCLINLEKNEIGPFSVARYINFSGNPVPLIEHRDFAFLHGSPEKDYKDSLTVTLSTLFDDPSYPNCPAIYQLTTLQNHPPLTSWTSYLAHLTLKSPRSHDPGPNG
uniref:Uncharacterized protein n=1 Tax=Kwoniella bestiolae CBS 10118 TaxID=1296100 RepID=A0A1B9FX68_9TREE|nr:hypothetical protein I302_06344 [Kwoniella bestiolae CBS 10118]OCF23363.1 hypothetical protein I302_06344 [Kwoniella bestiolae CBS 10118]